MTNRSIEESVRIERPRSEVFDAWSSGRQLAAWFAPMAVRPPDVEMLFEEGGPFTIRMDLGPGGIHLTKGRFLEIVPDECIRMTWHCDAWSDPPSEVKVTFEHDGSGTVVRVRHQRITSEQAREGQQFGWDACLTELRRVLVGHDQG